jgi:anion-transporting  ArsA/GET3 family ATPase
MGNAKELLTDEALTAFFFVTLPESLPIAVITRFINWFHEFGIPVGGVIVNGLIQKEQVGKDAAEFVINLTLTPIWARVSAACIAATLLPIMPTVLDTLLSGVTAMLDTIVIA